MTQPVASEPKGAVGHRRGDPQGLPPHERLLRSAQRSLDGVDEDGSQTDVSNRRSLPLLCQANYKGIEGNDWEELYYHYKEMIQATGVKEPSECQKKAKALGQ